MDAAVIYTNRDEFEKRLNSAFKDAGLKIETPLRKAVLNAFSEQDQNADICTDKKGNPEADTDLRDTESVPLNEDIYGSPCA